MGYTDLLVTSAGILTGSALFEYLRAKVLPLFRVRTGSGIPIEEMNKERAIALDQFLSEWSALLPSPHRTPLYVVRAELPEAVQQSMDMHINYKNHIGIPVSGDEDHVRNFQIMFQNKAQLKKQIREFYQEPAVIEYLRA